MPDSELKSVSATEIAALFECSPYTTRWMLYQKFANGLDIESDENDRMVWGKLLQPVLQAYAADQLQMEVVTDEIYVRRGMIGCTRDAIIKAPDKGPGALEIKCVFDYPSWMQQWGGGRFAPRHYELQLQAQMYVGDGETPYTWGILAPWVNGQQYYMERKPIPELWKAMEEEAAAFFYQVKFGPAPKPYGHPIELPLMAKVFPLDRGKEIDLQGDDKAQELADIAAEYEAAKAQEKASKKIADRCRARLLAAAEDAVTVTLPNGVRLGITEVERKASVTKASTSKRLTVYVPDGQEKQPDDLIMAG